MKKTLVSALTTALVVGAASTTFAASNPFSDVPADHWAYDAVSQLAADGIIDGYGDSTFQGSKNITRYEMAQMVAKAMAKNPSGVDKALVDKLAAEFADELNNLGVRVANLERNADMVKWNGEARFTYANHQSKNDGDDGHVDTNELKFRLEPTAEVNSNWQVKARLDANLNTKDDAGAKDDNNVKLKRVWAQGNYDNFTAKLGKFAPIDSSSIADVQFSGAEVAYGSQLKFTVGAGRLSQNETKNGIGSGLADNSKASNYQYAGLDYAAGKLATGVHYHHLGNKEGFYENGYVANGADAKDKANIWKLGADYRFDKNVALGAFYAKNSDADQYDHAWVTELNYKGAEKQNVGTWGAWVAYRYLGANSVINSTYDAIKANEKGWEIGTNYTLFKNTVLTGRYGWGKELGSHDTVHTVFGRVQFFF